MQFVRRYTSQKRLVSISEAVQGSLHDSYSQGRLESVESISTSTVNLLGTLIDRLYTRGVLTEEDVLSLVCFSYEKADIEHRICCLINSLSSLMSKAQKESLEALIVTNDWQTILDKMDEILAGQTIPNECLSEMNALRREVGLAP